MFVNCCHCSWCQRESGAAFAINAVIEADRVILLKGKVKTTTVPSNSGKGQVFSRCLNCAIALWSNYGGAGNKLRFIRVGTLIDPDLCPPEIHIYTSTKQSWVVLPDDVPSCTAYYENKQYWPPASLKRIAAVFA